MTSPTAPGVRTIGYNGGLRTASPALRQLMTFAAIGIVSTVAYLGLYSMLRGALAPAAANATALIVTAVANTAANRRLTFGVRGTDRLKSDHAAGMLAFAIALTISTLFVAGLGRVAPSASRGTELLVLAVANVVATGARFLVLRHWLDRPSSAEPATSSAGPAMARAGDPR